MDILEKFARNFINKYEKRFLNWGFILDYNISRTGWGYINIYKEETYKGENIRTRYGCIKITCRDNTPYIYSTRGFFIKQIDGEEIRIDFYDMINKNISEKKLRKYAIAADYLRADRYCEILKWRDENIYMIKIYNKESMVYKWITKKRKLPKLGDLSYGIKNLMYECLKKEDSK